VAPCSTILDSRRITLFLIVITPATATRITRRLGLPAVRTVTPISGGVINRSFLFELVDGALWVCRADVEGGRGKLDHEAEVYRWLWERAPGLPIATAYHVDPAKDILPHEYALLPRLPGANLGADIEHLPGPVREPLLQQVGALLRRLHDLIDADGELIDHHHRGQGWRDFVNEWFANMLGRCESRLGYPPAWAERARAWTKERIAIIPEAPLRVFLHGDFHFGNLQYALLPAPRVSGCFDFEWAWSGHSACDLLHLHEAATRYPEYEGALLAGYGVLTWPPELTVYRLIHSISVLGAAAVERPDPLWNLMGWHGAVIDNVLQDRPPFVGLLRGG
jgi:aminoglycoside phosphotransferase (APT) family kinase protein